MGAITRVSSTGGAGGGGGEASPPRISCISMMSYTFLKHAIVSSWPLINELILLSTN